MSNSSNRGSAVTYPGIDITDGGESITNCNTSSNPVTQHQVESIQFVIVVPTNTNLIVTNDDTIQFENIGE